MLPPNVPHTERRFVTDQNSGWGPYVPLSDKEDLEKITRATEEIRAQVGNQALQHQKWWEEKKLIYSKLILSLNQIADGLWNILEYGFDQEIREKTKRHTS